MPLPITQDSTPIVMFRVFHVNVRADKVTLTGAYGNEWEGTDLIGRCGGHNARYNGALSALRSGYVTMLRGERTTDTRQWCIDHLRDGVCTCGVWGYRDVDRLKLHGYLRDNGAAFDPLRDDLTTGEYAKAEVVAAVRAWGVVLEGEYGWRSSAARIEYLWVPQRLLHVQTSLPAAPYYCRRSIDPGDVCDLPGTHIDPKALLEVLCDYYKVRGQLDGLPG